MAQATKTDDQNDLVEGAAPLQGGLEPDAFKLAFRDHAAGVCVVTAEADGVPAALTATSVFSISATPPLFVFSLSSLSSSAPTIAAADTVVVHILGAGQLALAKLCATSGVDRFADTSTWSRLATGEPAFTDARVRIRGRIVERLRAGSSVLVVVHALEADIRETADGGEQPLVYHNRTWHALGEASQITS